MDTPSTGFQRGESDPELERLRIFADAAGVAIMIHEQGRILEVNRGFCDTLDCTPEDVIGLDMRERIHPVDRDRIAGLVHPDDEIIQRLRITTRSGKEMQLEGTGRPIVYRGRRCRVVTLVDIGARLEAERAARESERGMREMLESIPLMTVTLDLDGRIVFCNQELLNVTGYSREQLMGQVWEPLLGVGDEQEDREQVRRRIAGQVPAHEELPLRTRAGDQLLIAWSNTSLRDPDGRVIGCTAIGEDITSRRRAEVAAAARALQQSALARLGMAGLRVGVAELMNDAAALLSETLAVETAAVLRTEPRRSSLLLAAACGWPEGMAGRHRVAVAPGSLLQRVLGASEPVIEADVAAGAGEAGRVTDEHAARSAMGVPILGRESDPLGALVVHSSSVRAFTADDAHFLRVVANVLAAAIEREQARRHVEQLAYRDELTGLPNRALVLDRLDVLLPLAQRHGRAVAVIWVDVDRFQLVNDSFGQTAGDDVIGQVAGRLQAAAAGAELVARYAGDEFLLVVADGSEDGGGGVCSRAEDAAQIAQVIAGRVRAAFARPFTALGSEVFLRPCIGVALLPVHAGDRDGLLRHADVAKDQAKAEPRAGASSSRNRRSTRSTRSR